MKISIIIPTIGRETLNHVLESICDCDGFKKINPEILVVFDGKKNASITTKNKSIVVLETQKKVYSGGARNMGMDKATGDIIVFIGDDTIPKKDWLQRIYDFHTTHSNSTQGLLGKISWTKEIASDPFHKWLENNAQFDFKNLKTRTPSWKHFYTSNISIKKEIIEKNRFSDKFIGWGFEDTEFGYRLAKKGLQLHYDPLCEVFHDHRQHPEAVWKQTKNARKNAVVFETLHPELRILPRGIKKQVLKTAITLMAPLSLVSKKVRWLRQWKKAWIGKK